MRASGESQSAWRLESTTQQQWCTGYEPGGCCCSHPSSARERLLSRRWLGTSCSPARRRFETASRQCAPQWRCRAHCPSPARTGRTVASALVPRRGERWDESMLFPSSQPPTPGPRRLSCDGCAQPKVERVDARPTSTQRQCRGEVTTSMDCVTLPARGGHGSTPNDKSRHSDLSACS